MRKRIIVLTSMVLLMALLVVGGTMAWFSDKEGVNNEFIAGTVKVEINEHDFKDLTDVKAGDDATKEVSIINTGNTEAYIRVALIPQWDPNNLSIDVVTLHINSDNWVYKDGWYYYKKALAVGDETEKLLTNVKFAEDMGEEYENATFSIKVNAEAVQASNKAYQKVWGLEALPEGM